MERAPNTSTEVNASVKSPPSGKLRLGTCAWNFADWRDVFYPDSLASNAQLAYYARWLPAVEIDSTFYAIPRLTAVAKWAAETPDDFRFTAKLPKLITHEARLRGEDAGRVLSAFLGALRPLGEKLGAVLIQLPPSFAPTPADTEALREFLDLLPVGHVPFAVEFRHPAWHRPEWARLLEEHGVAWTWNDLSPLERQADEPFAFLPRTATFQYVRLMGDLGTKFRPDGERHFRYGRLLWAREAALDAWVIRLREAAADPGCQQIFVLVNNHFEGFSPLTCQRLALRLGIPLELPSLAERSQTAGPDAGKERDEQLGLFG